MTRLARYLPRVLLFPAAAMSCLIGCRTVDEFTSPGTLITEAAFVKADTDGDSKLSKIELARHKHREALAEFDLNRDNLISSAEWTATKSSPSETDEHFSRLDQNGDGRIEEDEAARYISEHVGFGSSFDAVDKNSDLHLDWGEIMDAKPATIDFTVFSTTLGE